MRRKILGFAHKIEITLWRDTPNDENYVKEGDDLWILEKLGKLGVFGEVSLIWCKKSFPLGS